MTDVRLRDAERRALSGSVEDQARALVARLRTAPGCERCGGTGKAGPWDPAWDALDVRRAPCPSCAGTGSPFRARVELAAYAGSEAARAACPDAERPMKASTFAPHERHEAFSGFISGLSRWSDISPGGPCAPACWGPNEAGERVHADGCRSFVRGWVLILASVAAARVAHKAARRAASGPGGQSMSALAAREALRASLRSAIAAIEAAEKWLACPCEEHERAVVSASGGSPGSRITFYEGPAILLRSWGIKEQWEQAVFRASELAGESPVLNAIRSSLIEWSLGGER
jgi:hypothetical protein